MVAIDDLAPDKRQETSVVSVPTSNTGTELAIESSSRLLGEAAGPVTPSLRTLFVPPSNCVGSTFWSTPSIDEWFTDHDGVVQITRGHTLSCYPTSTIHTDGFVAPQLTYSPGLICPFGYITQTNPYSASTRTTACCPTSLTFYNDPSCYGVFSTVVLISGTDTFTRTSAKVAEVAITLYWQASDTFPTLVDVTSSLTTTESYILPSSTSSDLSTTKNLTNGASAGIGVGTTMAAIAVAVGVFLVVRRQKNIKRGTVSQQNEEIYGKPELSGEGRERVELDSKGILHELGGEGKPQEVDNTPLAELEGDLRNSKVEVEATVNTHTLTPTQPVSPDPPKSLH